MSSIQQPSSSDDWVRSLIHSISLRLFLGLFAVIAVAFATYAVISHQTTSDLWQKSILEEAVRFSDLIQQATEHSMMRHRRDELHTILDQVAATPGVEGVRIYDKAGQIMSSSRPEEVGMQVDLAAEACVMCHVGPEPLATVPKGEHARVFRHADGHRVLGLINSVENKPPCSQAACHAHPPSQRVLGVLDVRMSLAPLDTLMATARRQAGLAALITALAAGLVAALFIHFLVHRPVAVLTAAAHRVAEGNLDTVIPNRRNDEIGLLAQTFNAMTRDLKHAQQELTGWSERLEERLDQKTQELTQTQDQIIHMEKMASLGQMAATVAHELNNPLAGILTYANLVDRTLEEKRAGTGTDDDHDELHRYLQLIQKEATRSGNIVRNLLLFSRRGGKEFAPQNLNQILNRAVLLVQHHMAMASITLDLQALPDDDTVVCDADQILQALVALMMNGVEAMPRGGTLTLTVTREKDVMRLQVTDTGVGIADTALPHIFEPFYTSKEDAQGAGLGLAVVYGIVQRHGGRIDVDSHLGRGTTFRIELPLRAPINPEKKMEAHHAA